MIFSEFQSFRDRALRERPDIIDCAETNLYASLTPLIPPPTPDPAHTVHRCHLAKEWAQLFGAPPGAERLALISRGVRDSLAHLFGYYARLNALLWIPADNYPVYGELARAAQLAPLEFPTLPEPRWPDAPPCHTAEVLLITNPLKPLGRWLSDSDVQQLCAWLAQSPRRRILLDAVYTFDLRFHPSTIALMETGQTILLHSLTKGWLHPKLFGIALIPGSDAPALSPVFREQAPLQASLARARELMGTYAQMPAEVASALSEARDHLFDELPASLETLSPEAAPGYLFPVKAAWSELLEKANILGIPAETFGSVRKDITILSSLNFTQTCT